MRFSENRWLVLLFWGGHSKPLNSARLIQYEGAFGGMSFVVFRGHIDETCSLPIFWNLCDQLWEQLIFVSMNLFCKPNYSDCYQAFGETSETCI